MAKKPYIVHRFKKMSRATQKAKQMKKEYGYKPSVFKVYNPKSKKTTYAVVKPKKLQKVRR